MKSALVLASQEPNSLGKTCCEVVGEEISFGAVLEGSTHGFRARVAWNKCGGT